MPSLVQIPASTIETALNALFKEQLEEQLGAIRVRVDFRGPSTDEATSYRSSVALTIVYIYYTIRLMILNFRHKGLRRLFEDDDRSKLDAQDVEKIARILARLNQSRTPRDMAVPGFRLHPLKGNLKGFWAVTVRANWRVIFRFNGNDALDVDLIDYH